MAFSVIAESKNQICRISKVITDDLILVGGLAVNQYVKTRISQDIDLICSDEMAKKIIEIVYPTKDWNCKDENDDDYRPSFVITHKLRTDYPAVRFGPKITERDMYEYINLDDLAAETQPFRTKNAEYQNIRIPSLEYLCYMKIISFLGRDISKKEKLKKDLKDVEDLCNNDSFRLGIFINLVRKYNLEDVIRTEFSTRLSYLSMSISDCNFGILTSLFYNCVKSERLSLSCKANDKFLVAFDVDGTLIKNIRHSWTLLWDSLGVDRSISEKRKNDFINGKLSYLEWASLDCKTLKTKGFKRSHISEIVATQKCSLTNNLIQAICHLKQQGAIVAIISGGVDALLYEILPEANDLFDDILINHFVFDDEENLVSISPTEYDWDDSKKGVVGKNRGLERLCEKYSIPISQSVFVGDDLNDFKAMRIAGRKIYYCHEQRNFGKKQLPPDVTIISEDNLMCVAEEILNKR